MKIKVTKKAMKENYKNIISVGYCNAQNMLRCKDAKMKLKKKWLFRLKMLIAMIIGGLLLTGMLHIYCNKVEDIRNGKIQDLREVTK